MPKSAASHSAYIKDLRKKHYKVFGKHQHSAAKLCLWTKKSIKEEGVCYKQKFYSINSHRCLQMTPNIYCNQRCTFCWRSWEFDPHKPPRKWDEPKDIVKESIEAQRSLLSGLGGIPERIDKQKFKEAQNPNQVAISLTGEPTIYPYLDELIKEYKKNKFTTFVVSNGMMPDVIAEIRPTQLYISLDAPTKQIHKKINAPQLKDSWERLYSTLNLLPSVDTRTVIRLTAVNKLNMQHSKAYVGLIKKAHPDFLEVKGYMFVGGSRQRLTIEHMPQHSEVVAFAEQINKHLNYDYIDEQPISRVVLYSSGEKNQKIS